MALLEGKRLLVTGVLTDSSIAFHVARIAQQEGATVVLTSFGRQLRITQTIARRLPQPAPVVELDVTSTDDLAALADRVGEHVDGLDGVLHSIGYAPAGAFDFLSASWEDVGTAVQVSAYSLKALAVAALPLMPDGGSVVGLTFDAQYAWPAYDWMGVAKAAFESTARYLARDLGPHRVRVNLVAAGPIRTTAAKSIPGFKVFEELGRERPRADRPGLRRAAVRLVPGHHGRDRARRRWLPCDGRLTSRPAGSTPERSGWSGDPSSGAAAACQVGLACRSARP
jgi:meromycolic acid enoyl-[acyl-carrier-protein] reductase